MSGPCSRINFESRFDCEVVNPIRADVVFQGRFTWEIVNPDGTVGRSGEFKNATTNAGLNSALSVYLAAGTQLTTWYMGLINNSGFGGLAAADTMSSHVGWTELTSYTESVRQTWTPGAVSGQSVNNPTAVAFTINATVTVNGAFLVSNSTKGGTTGTLWATGSFGSPQSLTSGQVLRLTYTCTATGA